MSWWMIDLIKVLKLVEILKKVIGVKNIIRWCWVLVVDKGIVIVKIN